MMVRYQFFYITLHYKVYVEHPTECITESHALLIAAFKMNSKWKGTGEGV